ncbi:hypothetical protein RHGRI_002184 [Rhododendron griersonianum]|uniref:DOG1 domain-containing protein n=1 Tax=Rhododendron griersonianum TaxID=479676 RepID=A0AAV6LMY1_9ERIC|nr:hypothetical protein RHGRI_002184 [Rhododendron griersonianum]
MAGHRIGGTAGLSDSGPSNYHLPYAVFHGINNPPTSFINQERSAFDFGELEEAIVLQGVRFKNDEASKSSLFAATRPAAAATLEMFPSWPPLRFHQTPTTGSSKSGGESQSTDSGSGLNTLSSSKAKGHIEAESPMSRKAPSSDHHHHHQHQAFEHHPQLPHQQQTPLEMISDGSGTDIKTFGSEQRSSKEEQTQEKELENVTSLSLSLSLSQAYVQQLETSRIKLAQLEQDLQRARSQGLFVGGGGGACGSISSGAAIFDMEYARWLDDDHRHMVELRTGLQAHLSDSNLRVVVDGYMAHYDEIFQLKGVAAKSDVFHLITGMWTTPAERCFLWMGGFRPSDLIKMLMTQLDPLTEQQVMGIYSLQQSSQQAEEALSQGLEQLQQSLVDTIAGGSVSDGMHHMAVALGKITNLEGFVRQLVVDIPLLWTMISDDNSCQTTTDLQMVQSSQHHFSNF